MGVRSVERCGQLAAMFAFMVVTGGLSSGQEVQLAMPAQVIEIQALQAPAAAIRIAGAVNDGSRSEKVQRWIRGFIQSELNRVETVCRPTPEQEQKLVDIAESTWKSRLASAIRAYAESENQRVPADFESRTERLVQTWLNDVLSEEQRELWGKEMENRIAFRRRLVIGRMVSDTERKLGLTHSQMLEIAEILQERWRDSWWSMYRSGTLPETKFSWISRVLSDAQRTVGNDRSSQMMEHFIGGGTVDMPTLDLKTRFQMGSVTSSSDIPLQVPDSTPTPKNIEGVILPNILKEEILREEDVFK
jgi:hypothetical protein